jgi:hypothetical protein
MGEILPFKNNTKKDFKAMKSKCEETSKLTLEFLDDFLVPYTIERESISSVFGKQLEPFKKAITKMPDNWPLFLITQYTSFLLFKNNGLANKYINHSAVKQRNNDEKQFMKMQIEYPWRLSFYKIKALSEPMFFELTDIFTDEVFILYSPGIDDILEKQKYISLTFLLISFNGLCWQTYGPNAYFMGIQPFDIRFLAQLIDPGIKTIEEVPDVIAKDPVPFMMLFAGANFPLVIHDDHIITHCKTELKNYDLDITKLSDPAIINKRQKIYKITLPETEAFPHFSVCYYHSKKRHLFITSMTEWGYNHIISFLNKSENNLPVKPDFFTTSTMFTTLTLNNFPYQLDLSGPYEKTFSDQNKTSKKENSDLKILNAALADIIEAKNSGKRIRPEKIADKHGLEIDDVQKLIDTIDMEINNF